MKVQSCIKISAVFATVLSLAGCGTYSDGFKDRLLVTKKQGLTRFEKYEMALEPKAEDAISQVRTFALQNIPGLSKDESDFIEKNRPAIQYDESSMEYSFFWKFSEKEVLEVITTPPPCKPIAAFRTTRVYFP